MSEKLYNVIFYSPCFVVFLVNTNIVLDTVVFSNNSAYGLPRNFPW